MNYQDCIAAWTALLEEAPSPYTPPTDMATLIPRCIEYAEGRIYRKLIFIANRVQVTSQSFAAGQRNLNIGAITPLLLTLEEVGMVTPVGQTYPSGTVVMFEPSSLDTVNMTWPSPSQTADPSTVECRRWALRDDNSLVVCPTPDQNYGAYIVGIQQPLPLSATNITTYLTNVYPELFLAAGMIFWAGYQRDYGSQSDDPRFATSWEQQYTTLENEALAEERRRRGLGPNQPLPLPGGQPIAPPQSS